MTMTPPPISPEVKPHYPVMLNEVMTYLNVKRGGVYVDGTFGVGGYTKAILEKEADHVIAFDQDPNAKIYADKLTEEFGEQRFTFIQDNFQHLKEHLNHLGSAPLNGLVLDLGVSSPQLDQAQRGFSFLKDGPLDMRMSQDGLSAADVVNTADQRTLTYIFKSLGEEKKASAIAKAIVQARSKSPLTTTIQLAELIKKQFTAREQHTMKIHPATRCFQALRIHVNDELGALENLLKSAYSLMTDGGRIVVVSFHSLEDRIVKKAFAEQSGQTASLIPKDLRKTRPNILLLTKKPILPSLHECEENPRSRSAKLRAAERILKTTKQTNNKKNKKVSNHGKDLDNRA